MKFSVIIPLYNKAPYMAKSEWNMIMSKATFMILCVVAVAQTMYNQTIRD
mgnify:CR=1 FL=1